MLRHTAGILTLVVLLAQVATSAAETRVDGSWVDERQVGPFIIQATFDLTPHASLLGELPELERELRRVLALAPCREPLGVLLFADETEYRAALSARFPEVPYRRALYVQQGSAATVFAYRHRELGVDLRHECTHALLHADLPMLPLWLDEGLAEYFEMPASERAFGNPHQEALRLNMRIGLVRKLTALESRYELADMSGRDYQFAWAWTHFLLHGPQPATEQLWKYLGAIRRGEPPGKMSERLESALPRVDRMLVTHFRTWSRLRVASQ